VFVVCLFFILYIYYTKYLLGHLIFDELLYGNNYGTLFSQITIVPPDAIRDKQIAKQDLEELQSHIGF
jgi:hypothetical protein